MPGGGEGPLIRYGDGKPQDFRGKPTENALGHWLRFMGWCKLQKVTTNADTVQRFLDTLSDDARIWAEDKAFTTKDQLKEAFLKKYSEIKSWQDGFAQWQNLTLKEGESVDDYHTRLQRLAEMLNYTDAKTLKDKFLYGLPPDIRKEAYKGGATLAECLTAAQDYMDIAGLTSSIKEVTFVARESEAPRESRSDRPRGRSERSRTPYRERSSSRNNRYRSYSRDRRSSSRGRYDRRRSASRDRYDRRKDSERDRKHSRERTRSSERKSGQNSKCAKCRDYGHRWRDCPVLESEMIENMKSEDF